MLLDGETLRFIFGFKLRGLRQEKNLSLKSLSEMTGLSASYINEIEKGKKYPKSDKILQLARTLGVSYDDLTSIKLKKESGLVAQILGNGMVRGLPFEVFGIPSRTLFALMAERPQNFSSLIGTVLELARNHDIKVEDFFYATLRAYLDSSGNHFPDLEKEAERFRKRLGGGLPTFDSMKRLLTEDFGYVIKEVDFALKAPVLRNLYFHSMPGKQTQLYLNRGLSPRESLFILCKEAGYSFLGLKERLTSNIHLNMDSFESLLSNFRAAYFASALLIPEDQLVREAEAFFGVARWDENAFRDWMQRYPAPPSAFFHRLSQILPAHFGLDQIFLLRFEFDPGMRQPKLIHEVHLSELHAPHEIRAQGHYCGRWITTSLLERLGTARQELVVGAQRSEFFGVEKEYLCFCAAYRKELGSLKSESVTIGIRVSEELRKRMRALDDPAIVRRQVGDTCEKCGIEACRERSAAPVELERFSSEAEIAKALGSIHEIL